MPKQQKQQQYDARKLYRNGTTIEVPGHTALKICDKITGAKNNFCIPKATDLKETFGKERATELVTIKFPDARELTFTKKNTNAGSNVKNVKGAYFCTVEDVELWIQDSTRPTEFTPVFLAFNQQKKTPITTRDLHLIKTTEKLAYHKELLLIYRDARQTGCRW